MASAVVFGTNLSIGRVFAVVGLRSSERSCDLRGSFFAPILPKAAFCLRLDSETRGGAVASAVVFGTIFAHGRVLAAVGLRSSGRSCGLRGGLRHQSCPRPRFGRGWAQNEYRSGAVASAVVCGANIAQGRVLASGF